MLRERLLSTLIVAYAILLILDPSFPSRSLTYVNFEAISLILSFMLVSKLMDVSGMFSRISSWILSLKGRSRLILLLLASELIAALLMNDTALFILVPLVMTLYRVTGGDPSGTLVLVTVAANVGSALTPFGNPQNIIIWSHFKVDTLSFLLTTLPFFSVSSLLLVAFSLVIPVTEAGPTKLVSIRLDSRAAMSAIFLLVFNLILAGSGLYIVGVVITLIVSLLVRREVIGGVDVPLLAMFAFLFMDFGEISYLLGSAGLIPPLHGVNVLITSALLSQVISNVPATITLLHHTGDWKALLVGVNLGGTGIIIGSMANFIALRLADLRIGKFHRISVPFFLASLAIFLLLAWAQLYP